MGAWGSDSFENDDAPDWIADWIADFCDAPDKESISDVLSTVAEMDTGEYLGAPDCSVGLAAAEVVAALKGAPNPNMPDDAKERVARLKIKVAPSMVSLSLRAVERVKTNSELKELRDESENPDEWYRAIGNLEVRLKQ